VKLARTPEENGGRRHRNHQRQRAQEAEQNSEQWAHKMEICSKARWLRPIEFQDRNIGGRAGEIRR
jgi:hypothetical protein